MSTLRTHFTFRVDTWTPDGESIVEHVAGIEDYEVALATFRAACQRWPGTPITLRHARVIEDRPDGGFVMAAGRRRGTKPAPKRGRGWQQRSAAPKRKDSRGGHPVLIFSETKLIEKKCVGADEFL